MNEVNQPSASIWRRAVACTIDIVLVPVLALLLMLVTGALESAEAYSHGFPYYRVFFLGVASYLLLNGWLLWQKGQTLGKYWLKVKIFSSKDCETASIWKPIFVRALFCPLPLLVLVGFSYFVLVDLIFIFGKDRRCLHDYAADTFVKDVS